MSVSNISHRAVAWYETEIHTMPFNCGREDEDCGCASYTFVMCSCGEEFPIDQWGNYSSSFAVEYTAEQLRAVEEHCGIRVEDVDLAGLAYMRGRGSFLHEVGGETMEWRPA